MVRLPPMKMNTAGQELVVTGKNTVRIYRAPLSPAKVQAVMKE